MTDLNDAAVDTHGTTVGAARAWYAAGGAPVHVRADGSKAPIPRWKHIYEQRERPSVEQLRTWFVEAEQQGLGIICGAVSGNLELFEFEGRVVAAGLDLAHFDACEAAGLGDVINRVWAGYCERTPSGGIHLFLRVTDGEALPNSVFAERPSTAEELVADPKTRKKVLIETRGEGGFAVVAPSHGTVHETGLAWELLNGGPDTIAEVTCAERDAIYAIARTFDQMPRQEPRAPTERSAEDHGDLPGDFFDDHGDRPGDLFDAAIGCNDVFAECGWTIDHEDASGTHWRRPGKNKGSSACTYPDGLACVFSTSVDGVENPGHNRLPPFRLLAQIAFGGEYSDAARALAAQGYTTRTSREDVLAWIFSLPKVMSDDDDDDDDETTQEQTTTEPKQRPKLDERAFYGLAGEVVRVLAPETEADPVALLVHFLTAFGNAVGPAPHFTIGGDNHTGKINALFVGRTGRARKGTADAIVKRVFANADKNWYGERCFNGIASGEGLIAFVRDEYDDEGNVVPCDKRAYAVESEFARLLAAASRDGSTVSAVIRQGFDQGTLRVLTRRDPLEAYGTHISIVGHITEVELRKRLDNVEIGNGLANRFLFHCVERVQLLPSGGSLTEKDFARLGALVRERLEAGRKIATMRRSPEAEEVWSEMYGTIAAHEVGGLADSLLARQEVQLLRLAIVFALTDGTPVIEVDHLEAAWAVVGHADESVLYLYGDQLGDPVADTLLTRLRALPEGEGLDGTAMSALFSRHVASDKLGKVLGDLVARGLVRIETIETGGRPRQVAYATGSRDVAPTLSSLRSPVRNTKEAGNGDA